MLPDSFLQVFLSGHETSFKNGLGTSNTEEVGHSRTSLFKMAEITLIDLGYCKVESFLAFSVQQGLNAASADHIWKFSSLNDFNYHQLASTQVLGHQWAARHATI